jgi:hypothetical protein
MEVYTRHKSFNNTWFSTQPMLLYAVAKVYLTKARRILTISPNKYNIHVEQQV